MTQRASFNKFTNFETEKRSFNARNIIQLKVQLFYVNAYQICDNTGCKISTHK